MRAYGRTSIYDPMGDLPLWAINVLLVALFAWMFLRLTDEAPRHRAARLRRLRSSPPEPVLEG